MLAVVLTFDEFPVSLLGCYGDHGTQTPCLNQIASRGMVFDQHFGDDYSSEEDGHAWWSGRAHFPHANGKGQTPPPSFPKLLEAAGVDSHWLSDSQSPSGVSFPEGVPPNYCDSFEQMVRAGCEVIEQPLTAHKSNRMLWLKAGASVWNPSQLLSTESAEQEEADEVLRTVLGSFSSDPLKTDRSQWSEAEWSLYRGLMEQAVAAIDRDFTPLWQCVQAVAETEPVIFIFTAARGMALVEQRLTTKPPDPWTEDRVHLPLVIYDSRFSAGDRRSEFTQAFDLPATLLDFLAVSPTEHMDGRSLLPMFRGEADPWREFVTYGSIANWEAIRRADFHLVRVRGDEKGAEEQIRLFLKPDDFWDWHDIADHEPQMAQTLSDMLDASLSFVRNGNCSTS